MLDWMEFQASHNYGLAHIACIKIGKHQTMHTAHTHWKILIGVFSSEFIKNKTCAKWNFDTESNSCIPEFWHFHSTAPASWHRWANIRITIHWMVITFARNSRRANFMLLRKMSFTISPEYFSTPKLTCILNPFDFIYCSANIVLYSHNADFPKYQTKTWKGKLSNFFYRLIVFVWP